MWDSVKENYKLILSNERLKGGNQCASLALINIRLYGLEKP